ncbi:energy-coupled thiamine transporter ThiT [Priestia koreensis]|uniref:energy-coupled thiamine transporter ThiT n=1 Tax=Priestia koreensis TaxID=284581 RepID=UPI001F5863A1|nr:energy-coupled thiamine transporter ThiT [Priestia koreensis]MCM3004307.1 energy-coupled thiamine transporter ThiT [Priestia koreensis]UNL83521.1 energy-coupled thiamine transporter ThiT [Priestia koreensis]
MKQLSLVAVIEIAIFAAISLILDLLISFKISSAISISFAMVPVMLIAFRWGVKGGTIAGLLWGILQLIIEPSTIGFFIQPVMEYIIAFACIGFTGLYARSVQKHAKEGNRPKLIASIIAGVFIGSVARYIWHFIAGIIFWGKYAPKGQSAFVYSLISNGVSMLGSFVLCAIILSLIIPTSARLVLRRA